MTEMDTIFNIHLTKIKNMYMLWDVETSFVTHNN